MTNESQGNGQVQEERSPVDTNGKGERSFRRDMDWQKHRRKTRLALVALDREQCFLSANGGRKKVRKNAKLRAKHAKLRSKKERLATAVVRKAATAQKYPELVMR